MCLHPSALDFLSLEEKGRSPFDQTVHPFIVYTGLDTSVVSLRSLVLSPGKKERGSFEQAVQTPLSVHVGLDNFAEMDGNAKSVTLNDLQASLKDIKQNLCWLYNIVNRGQQR